MKGDEKKCIEAGCDAYIPKPIDRRELLKIIGKYLPSKELDSIGTIEELQKKLKRNKPSK